MVECNTPSFNGGRNIKYNVYIPVVIKMTQKDNKTQIRDWIELTMISLGFLGWIMTSSELIFKIFVAMILTMIYTRVSE